MILASGAKKERGGRRLFRISKIFHFIPPPPRREEKMIEVSIAIFFSFLISGLIVYLPLRGKRQHERQTNGTKYEDDKNILNLLEIPKEHEQA